MASVNQATIIGNIGQEPKITPTKDNSRKIVSFSVATTEKGYKKHDGTKTEDVTDWHNVVLFGNLAEIAAKYLHKGMMVYIQGKMRTRAYDDKTGQKRYVTEIIGDVMQMLSKADKPQENANQTAYPIPSYANDAPYPYQPAPVPSDLRGRSVAEMLAGQNGAVPTDDLPF